MPVIKKQAEWMLDAVPGSREAFAEALAEIEAADAAREPLKAARKAAMAAYQGKIWYDGERAIPRTSNLTTAEAEALWAAGKKAEADLAATYIAGPKQRAFERMFTRDALDAAGVVPKVAAAQYALKQHAAASEAWAVLSSASRNLADAYEAAGRPGNHWAGTSSELGAFRVTHSRDTVEYYFECLLGKLDTWAIDKFLSEAEANA